MWKGRNCNLGAIVVDNCRYFRPVGGWTGFDYGRTYYRIEKQNSYTQSECHYIDGHVRYSTLNIYDLEYNVRNRKWEEFVPAHIQRKRDKELLAELHRDYSNDNEIF